MRPPPSTNAAFLLTLVTLGALAIGASAQEPDGRDGRRRRGGFNPADAVQRFDQNKNGKLDPDEVDRRSRMFLKRFAPDVDLSKPISIKELKKRIVRAEGRNGDRGGRRNQNESTFSAPVMEALVPGFGDSNEEEPPNVPGFGTLGEFFAVTITAADKKETIEAFKKYDRDGDDQLDRRELRRGNWFDDPTAYDQNRDGRLSKREMAVRYARRRLRELANHDKEKEREKRKEKERARKASREQEEDSEDSVNRRGFYRFLTAHERLPKDVPGWFREKDADTDGQVSMAEYWSESDLSSIDAFNKLDWNGDGYITPRESMGRMSRGGGDSESASLMGEAGTSGAGKSQEVTAADGAAKEIPERY